MAVYKLIGVPLVKQQNPFSCWYASVCMVNYCFEMGPRLGMPDEYKQSKTSGLSNSLWGKLAEAEGLRSILSLEEELWIARRKGKQPGFKFNDLAYLLDRYGPIWTVIDYGNHAVVVTGVESGTGGDSVLYNDPADARAKSMPLDNFNKQVNFYDEHVMLCRPQAEYSVQGSMQKVRRRAAMGSVLSVQYKVWPYQHDKI